ncbi:MAG: ureidoglycolate lyase [Gammaproteobacteria bacterium]|jgi:ureidoglycolate lyase
MNIISLEVNKLTKESFEVFGDVIEADGEFQKINQGTTLRFNDLVTIDVTENSGRPLFNIFRASPRPRPIQVKLLERHPISSQLFFPLHNKPYLVLVAPAVEKIDVNNLFVFHASGRQGVNYHRDIWHHPLLAIDEVTDFIVIDRGGEGENCDEFYFAEDSNIFIKF